MASVLPRKRTLLIGQNRKRCTETSQLVSLFHCNYFAVNNTFCFLHQRTAHSNHKITFSLVLENDTGRCRKKVGDRIGINNSEPDGNTRRVWITMGMFFTGTETRDGFFKSLSKMDRSGPKERPGRFLIFSEATPFYIKI